MCLEEMERAQWGKAQVWVEAWELVGAEAVRG